MPKKKKLPLIGSFLSIDGLRLHPQEPILPGLIMTVTGNLIQSPTIKSQVGSKVDTMAPLQPSDKDLRKQRYMQEGDP